MNTTGQSIATAIADVNGLPLAKLGLRFDKVVIRFMSAIRPAVEKDIPNGTAVILTVTAPIKQPAKTADEVITKIQDALAENHKAPQPAFNLMRNAIRLTIIPVSAKCPVRLVGLVHNADMDPLWLTELTAKWATDPQSF